MPDMELVPPAAKWIGFIARTRMMIDGPCVKQDFDSSDCNPAPRPPFFVNGFTGDPSDLLGLADVPKRPVRFVN